VREALRLLEIENLVRRQAQSGNYVTPVSSRLVKDGAFIRRSVEQENVRELAEFITSETLGELEKLIELQMQAINSEDRRDFHALDEAFHRSLFKAAGRQEVWESLQPSKLHVDRARIITLGAAATAERAIDDHRRVLDALSKHDAEASAAAMANHLRQIEHLIARLSLLDPQYVE
jgi:DNA-binding GntR family transcriptional regulator